MTTVTESTDKVPDMADGLHDIGTWLGLLAGALDRMPQPQRRELLRITRNLRGDLAAINLGIPAGWTR